jgi:hypothetical protein
MEFLTELEDLDTLLRELKSKQYSHHVDEEKINTTGKKIAKSTYACNTGMNKSLGP